MNELLHSKMGINLPVMFDAHDYTAWATSSLLFTETSKLVCCRSASSSLVFSFPCRELRSGQVLVEAWPGSSACIVYVPWDASYASVSEWTGTKIFSGIQFHDWGTSLKIGTSEQRNLQMNLVHNVVDIIFFSPY